MKRYNPLKYILIAFLATGLGSCEKDFEEINTNPNASTRPSANFLFSRSLIFGNSVNTSVYMYTSYLTSANYIQHFATYKEINTGGIGDKYGQNDQIHGIYFRSLYNLVLTSLQEGINAAKAEGNPNKEAAARIYKALLFQRLTDIYGDVPYKEALKAYSDKIYTPKYDPQSEIYADLLKELDEATKQFDASKPTYGAADFIYGGNVDKWKKLGYSLMLRVAMRMTKVDATKAREWATKAIAGGVILNSADIAYIKHTDGTVVNRNPIAQELVGQDYVKGRNGKDNTEGGKFSKTFIDRLQSKLDPRLPVIAVIYNGDIPDNTIANQKGLPNGLASEPANIKSYSEPNPKTILNYAAPYLVLTNAETNFLLAEAALRGWTGGSAAAYFKAGIEASMRNWALFGADGQISETAINTYTAANPLNTAGSFDAQMNQIHSEFWVALLLDEQETYANWRRTGYPVLTPVNFPGNFTNGTIPRRFRYSQAEDGANQVNYRAAVARQGPDLLTTRMWWDKP